MKKNYKIVFVGASYLFCHRVFKDLVKISELREAKVVIFDIDPEPIKYITGVCRIMNEISGTNITVEGTTNRKKALEGADYVMLCINVGSEGADREIMKICSKYKISNTVGDTIGPSALVRSMRNIEAIMVVARDMEKVCPEAWLVNFSNPMSQLTLAVQLNSSIKCVGLCHCIGGVEEMAGKIYNVEKKDVSIIAAGTNHFTWVKEVWVRGENKTSSWYNDFSNHIAKPKTGKKDSKDWLEKERLTEEWAITKKLFEYYGMMPIAGDKHIVEFFPYFLDPKTRNGKDYGLTVKDYKKKSQGRIFIKKLLKKWIARKEDPWDMDKPSGEEAHNVMMAIIRNKGEVLPAVNVLNNGSIRNLPDDCCVEVPAAFGQYGYKTINIGELPQPVAEVVGKMAAIHRLTVDASMTGDRKLALKALMLDPLLKDFNTADKLLEEMLVKQKRYLPKFF
ncbi:MAG: hypothetical protein WCI43_01835 [Candidatus Firestonebacteria bacterium]